MTKKYELLEEKTIWSANYNNSWYRVSILMILCSITTLSVFFYWNNFYRFSLQIPPKLTDTPTFSYQRAIIYSKVLNNPIFLQPHINLRKHVYHDKNGTNIESLKSNNSNYNVKRIDDLTESELIYPSKLGQFFYKEKNNNKLKKLVCYYSVPYLSNEGSEYNYLEIDKIDPNLCTHLNIGMLSIENCTLQIDSNMHKHLSDVHKLKKVQKDLKILLWIGGPPEGSRGFSAMVVNHANRKLFIKSIKSTLESYKLDGIDLDWEFPSAHSRERQHFSQLLHEIRREYEREHRSYLLSVAVAAPEGIAYISYDIKELQNYCDYINIMSYDFHFYTSLTPFTGLNSPLYPRSKEAAILQTLNINYTVNFWNSHGIDKEKIIIGLPTYGHSFRLYNPLNNKIGSPAKDIGSVGNLGFASYSEICWFIQNNIYVTKIFDTEACSPYLYSGLEWISYENDKSIECKTKYILNNNFGGAMIFSLNSDDFDSYCLETKNNITVSGKPFPLINKVRSILFNNKN